MSFEAQPGVTWTPQSAGEWASDVLVRVNAYIKAAGAKDPDGNQIQLAPVTSNSDWLLILGVADMLAEKDADLLEATHMFSVSEASDDQILEDLTIAGTSLIPGAFSLATVTVTADGSGSAVVPMGSKIPLGTICNFVTLADLTVTSGNSGDVLCEADIIGPIAAGPGSLVAFQTTIPHVLSVTNAAAAILGRDEETVQQVRQRLVAGQTEDTNLDGTIRAIRSVQGITLAQVYLNQSPTAGLSLPGSITVPPLSAYIVVLGTDVSLVGIAAAYAQRMIAQTYSTGTGDVVTRSDISFASGDNSINTVAGNFTTKFAANDWIKVSGSASNNFAFKVVTITAAKMVVTGPQMVTTTGVGASITLTELYVQEYETQSGQVFPIQYDLATSKRTYVKLYYDAATVTDSNWTVEAAAIVSEVIWAIGDKVTATKVLAAFSDFQFALVTGAQVSFNGANWFYEVEAPANTYPSVATGDVSVST